MKLYKLIILLLLLNTANAQKISGEAKFPQRNFKIEVVDTIITNIYYDYKYSYDKKNIKARKNTSTVLQIGKDKVCFTDINRLKYDSLALEQSKKDFLDANDINTILPIRKAIVFNKIILKSFNDNDYMLQGFIYNKTYQFTEQMPSLQWELKESKKVILNYKCKEAILNYGGRKWTAFYTEDIPLSEGPYIFKGLPGLILEIYDENNEHHFIAQGINNNFGKIYFHNENDILFVNKNEFYKTENNFHENPKIFIDAKIYKSPNVEEKNSSISNSIPYNPIELE